MWRVLTSIVLFAMISVAISDRLYALTEVRAIQTPEDCPVGLRIATKSRDGMLDVVIRIDPDKVEQIDLYRGRINAACYLDLRLDDERIARTQLQGEFDRQETVFRLTISKAAAQSSRLDLGTHLYEKDGMPTIGGGSLFQISLAGFVPVDGQPPQLP